MIQIKPIEAHEVEAAKGVIVTVCCEVFAWTLTPDEMLKRWDERGILQDVDDVQSHYFDNQGTFLVLVDDERVMGTGAIRRLADDTCELKRMWFLKEYRGKGFGMQMAQRLLDFARQAGYQKVKLDTGQQQEQAIRLYERLGFYFIERYNDGPCNLFMEKIL